MPKPILYWNKVCPFVHRAWIAAIEKNVDLELVHISLGDDKPEWYTKDINPAGTVPTLRTEDGKLVFESLYIAQYLDETYGVKRALQPGDAQTQYKLRLFLKEAGDAIGPLYGLLRASKEDEAAARTAAVKALDSWEAAYAASSEGPYFFGQTFTLADIHIVPFLDRFRHTLKAYHDFDVFEGHPRLARLMREASVRPSLTQTMQPGSFYTSLYSHYTGRAPSTPKWKLYISQICPFCDIARIAANLKKAELEVVEIDLENVPQWYIDKVNPKGEVPSLELAPGNVVRESLLVAEFLDDSLASGLTLTAADPQARADTRYWLNGIAEARGDYYGAAYGAGDDKASAEKGLVEDLGFLERLLGKQSSGPFFLGQQPSLAEAGSVSFLVRFEAVYHQIPGAKPFSESFPRIASLLATARDTEGFKEVLRTREAYTHLLSKKH